MGNSQKRGVSLDSEFQEFREITQSDQAKLTKFFLSNRVPEVENSFTAFPLSSETAEYIATVAHKDKYFIYAENGKFLGFSMLRGWDEGFSIPSFGIFVDHLCQGRGLGKFILKLTMGEAEKIGCKKVRLSVYASNRAGIHIYQDFGFTETERQAITVNQVPDEKIIMYYTFNY